MKKIKRYVFVWRESVYKNDFKCKCNFKLTDGIVPKNELLYDRFSRVLFCPLCKQAVCKIKRMRGPANIEKGLYGNIDEYKRR